MRKDREYSDDRAGRLAGQIAYAGFVAVFPLLLVLLTAVGWSGSRRGSAGVPGALIGGPGWTLLQDAGAQLVRHQLQHLSNLYGTFATVLGLMWWIALGASISVLAAELNVVVDRRLWPPPIRLSGTARRPDRWSVG